MDPVDDLDVVELELAVDPAPAGWVAVALDEAVDPDGWALAVHRFLAEDLVLDGRGDDLDADRVDAAAAVLGQVARVARRRAGELGGFAHAWIGSPAAATPVWVHAVARPEDGFTAWAERRFAEEIPAADPRAVVEEVALPAGPALRVRSVHVPDELDQVVTEGVDVLVRPRHAPGRVLLSSVWTALAHGDELAALVDEYAGSVRVRVVPPGERRR